jgi:hypothetical protein
LLKTTVALYVRHTLIGNQNPLELETAFYDAAREIRAQFDSKVPSKKCLQAAKTILKKLNPSDGLVQQKFEELILSKSEASWMLTQIANAQQSATKEVKMALTNLEHIFPQNAGAAWPGRAQLEPLIWHVGNLTILSKRINAKAQNKSFADKCRDHYKDSEVKMTQALLKEKKWDESSIIKRAKALAKIATQVWV